MMAEETNNTVAEVEQSMTQDTDENFKTFVDDTTIGVEAKQNLKN
jgi:hypothetical protein